MPTDDQIELTNGSSTDGRWAVDLEESSAPERIAPEASVDAVDDLLDEVEQALSRLDDGTYGQCASCGAPIGDDRLAADPTADICAACRPSAP